MNHQHAFKQGGGSRGTTSSPPQTQSEKKQTHAIIETRSCKMSEMSNTQNTQKWKPRSFMCLSSSDKQLIRCCWVFFLSSLRCRTDSPTRRRPRNNLQQTDSTTSFDDACMAKRRTFERVISIVRWLGRASLEGIANCHVTHVDVLSQLASNTAPAAALPNWTLPVVYMSWSHCPAPLQVCVLTLAKRHALTHKCHHDRLPNP